MTGKIVTLVELVEILDVSPKAVRDMMISPSFPFHEKNRRGKAHLFDTAAVVNWLRERERKRAGQKPDGDDPKSRTQRAAAEIKELELAEKRGDLFHLSDWEPFICDRLVVARTELCQISAQFREEFSEPPPINTTVRWLNDRIVATLNRLSGGLKSAPDEVGTGR